MTCPACNGTGFGPCQDHLEACEKCGGYADGIDALLAAKDAEIERLRDALGVFADPASWADYSDMLNVNPNTTVWLLDRSYPNPAAFARKTLDAKPSADTQTRTDESEAMKS